MIKPAEDTPLSALAMVALAEKAGFPAGIPIFETQFVFDILCLKEIYLNNVCEKLFKV